MRYNNSKWQSDFASVLFLGNVAFGKFHENGTLSKNSEFTVQ